MTSAVTLSELAEFCQALRAVTKDPSAYCRFKKRAVYTPLQIQVFWELHGRSHAYEMVVSQEELAGGEVFVFERLLDIIGKEMASAASVVANAAGTDFKTR